MHIRADTLDDLLRQVFGKLLKSPNRTASSKGKARELIAVLLTLGNPRARLSRTEGRATPFSCLGETLWYLAGSDRLDVIEYHIRNYRKFLRLPDSAVSTKGAYGPRIFGPGQSNQMERVIDILDGKRDTRQAVIQIFDESDLENSSGDVPCTCTLQFFKRDGQLHMLTSMRSNDAYMGLPHDVFAFTVIQELVARRLTAKLGVYHHSVGSLHLYDENEVEAKLYLNEGWHERIAMPPMPQGDPWPSINWLLRVEESIRLGHQIPVFDDAIDPYWLDLGRLLKIRPLVEEKDKRGIVEVKNSMHSKVYDTFIRKRERRAAPERGNKKDVTPTDSNADGKS